MSAQFYTLPKPVEPSADFATWLIGALVLPAVMVCWRFAAESQHGPQRLLQILELLLEIRQPLGRDTGQCLSPAQAGEQHRVALGELIQQFLALLEPGFDRAQFGVGEVAKLILKDFVLDFPQEGPV